MRLLKRHKSRDTSRHSRILPQSSGILLPQSYALPYKQQPQLTRVFDSWFPLYLTISFFGLFVCFGSARVLLNGVEDYGSHPDEGKLSAGSWIWGALSGFLRINPACSMMMAMCSVSLSYWSKHRSQHLKNAQR